MLGLDSGLDPVIYILLGAIGSTAAWLFLGPYVSDRGLSRALKRLTTSQRSGDKEALERLGDVLLSRMVVPIYDSGQKDEQGKPIMISPIQVWAGQIGQMVEMRFKSMMGIDKHQANALNRAISTDMLNGANPMLSAILDQFPTVKKKITEKPEYASMFLQKVAPMLNKGGSFNTVKGDASSTLD